MGKKTKSLLSCIPSWAFSSESCFSHSWFWVEFVFRTLLRNQNIQPISRAYLCFTKVKEKCVSVSLKDWFI